MSQLSITVDTTDEAALNRASLMLGGLANDATNEKPVQHVESSNCNTCENNIDADNSHIEAKIPVSEGGTMIEDDDENKAAKEVFGADADTGEIVATGNTETGEITPVDVELDKAGFPWDERIHGKAKKKTAKDGRWTKIKNLDKNSPGLFDEVIAELTAKGFGPGKAEATTTTSTDNVVDINANKAPAPAPAPTQTEALAPAPAPAPAPVVEASYIASDGKTYTETALRAAGHTDETLATLQKVEAAAPAPTTETTTTEITFPVLMGMITPALAANTITQQQINDALAVHGLTSLPLLSAQPQFVPAVKQALFG